MMSHIYHCHMLRLLVITCDERSAVTLLHMHCNRVPYTISICEYLFYYSVEVVYKVQTCGALNYL